MAVGSGDMGRVCEQCCLGCCVLVFESCSHGDLEKECEIVRIETDCLDRPDFGLANARILLDRLISNFRDLEAGEDHRRPTVRFAEAEWRRMAEIDERCTLVARFVKERPPLELIRARIGEVVSLEGGSCSETETEIVEEAVSKVKGKKVVSVVGDKGEDRAEKLGSK
nr:TMV resistance protein N-like [Ipomoea batatas]